MFSLIRTCDSAYRIMSVTVVVLPGVVVGMLLSLASLNLVHVSIIR